MLDEVVSLVVNGFDLDAVLDMTDTQRRLWIASVNRYRARTEKQ